MPLTAKTFNNSSSINTKNTNNKVINITEINDFTNQIKQNDFVFNDKLPCSAQNSTKKRTDIDLNNEFKGKKFKIN